MSGGAAGGGAERRRAERVPMPADGPVSVVGARLTSVSPFGMKIESPLPMAVDSVLQFRLTVAGDKTDVDARVASCVPAGPDRRGFDVGLEFTEISAQLRDRLRDVLAQLHGPRT